MINPEFTISPYDKIIIGYKNSTIDSISIIYLVKESDSKNCPQSVTIFFGQVGP